MDQPTFDPASAAPHFDACVTAIGSYAEAARRMGLKTAWGVQKWRSDGVPHDRVISFAMLSGWKARPHDLRPDIYPHPDDGLPNDMRGGVAA
jgi:hypothetical protein